MNKIKIELQGKKYASKSSYSHYFNAGDMVCMFYGASSGSTYVSFSVYNELKSYLKIYTILLIAHKVAGIPSDDGLGYFENWLYKHNNLY